VIREVSVHRNTSFLWAKQYESSVARHRWQPPEPKDSGSEDFLTAAGT
jgi:hypothetical protein